MKKSLPLLAAALLGLAAGAVDAEKPEWAEKSAQAGQMQTEKAAGQPREREEERYREREDKGDKAQGSKASPERQREQRAMDEEKGGKEMPPGQAKQREMKMEQEQKELGKGSEQGQESREQRRKWWRFWE